MSLSREDLVAYAINGLDDRELARIENQLDGESRKELSDIRRHLALHDAVEEIHPDPRVWENIRDTIDTAPVQKSVLQRFWMPMAAAAMVLVAVFAGKRPEPAGPAFTRLHGAVARGDNGTLTCSKVARIAIGDGVVVTMDADTTIRPLSDQRLALEAGRVFFEVAKGRRGFAVEAGGLTVVTTGTAFSVSRIGGEATCAVAEGSVTCTAAGKTAAVEAGRRWSAGKGLEAVEPATLRAWFSQPTITAQILAPERVAIVIRNDMPDTIEKAPPTGGEPLFYATFSGNNRSVPLAVELDAPLTLAPGEDKRFEVRLPTPLLDGEALFISSPALNLRVEAK